MTKAQEKTARIAKARRLRNLGVRRTEIASQLGVTPSTIDNWMKARQCIDCDEFVVRGDAVRCLDCAQRHVSMEEGDYWPQEQILDAINAFFVRTGRAPTSLDWRVATKKTPNRNQVVRRFGTFNAAIRAAGLTPRKTGKRFNYQKERYKPPTPTMANGFTADDELRFLIAEQAADDGSIYRWASAISLDVDVGDGVYLLDYLALRTYARSGKAYTDAWVDILIAVIDRRREIDSWADGTAA